MYSVDMTTVRSASDVAAALIDFSLNTGEPVTNMKLQKLLYYAYSWYLVNKSGEDRLFTDDIEAWQYGPVVRTVYSQYSDYGADIIAESVGGDMSKLGKDEMRIIEDVFRVYGDKTALELMDLSHSEKPWRDTYREGQKKKIDDGLILSYYAEKLQKSSSQ